LTLSGTETQINAALATLSYQGVLNFNGGDTLTVLSTDSAGTPLSDSDPVAITVNAVNDAPVLDLLNTPGVQTAGTTASFTENGGAVTIAPQLALSDVDSATLAGATVTLTDPQTG